MIQTKTYKYLFLFTVFILSITLTSCSKKVNRINSSRTNNNDQGQNPTGQSNSNGNPATNPGSGGYDPNNQYAIPTPDYGINNPGCSYKNGVGSSPNDIYETPNTIIVKGVGRQNGGHTYWTSLRDRNIDQNRLKTDMRFKVRVLGVFVSGSSSTYDGQPCSYEKANYTKLRMTIGVKAQGMVATYREFETSVNSCSPAHEFSVPRTSDPLIIEVSNVRWDWSCIYEKMDSNLATQIGLPQTYMPSTTVCPWDPVWAERCVGFKIQVSTDNTKDFP